MPRKLGVTTTQRKTMLRNLATDLLWYGRIETTLARAKELKPYAEKIITLAITVTPILFPKPLPLRIPRVKKLPKRLLRTVPLNWEQEEKS